MADAVKWKPCCGVRETWVVRAWVDAEALVLCALIACCQCGANTVVRR